MTPFQEWQNNDITKSILSDIEEAIAATREESAVRDTVDQTAMATSYNEGFIDGIQAFKDSIEDRSLNDED